MSDINKLKHDNIFFTSDTMFGRKNILSYRKKFHSIEEMNNYLIERWNKVINEDSHIYHLGNFVWEPFLGTEVLNQLNGTIEFLIGNYDKSLYELLQLYDNIILNEDQIVEIPELDVVLCHYPLEYWNNKDKNTIHIHGHTYDTLPTDLSKMNRINVCTDFWNYTPVSFDLIKDLIISYKNAINENK